MLILCDLLLYLTLRFLRICWTEAFYKIFFCIFLMSFNSFSIFIHVSLPTYSRLWIFLQFFPLIWCVFVPSIVVSCAISFFGTRQLYHCFIVLSVCSSWKRLSQFSFEIDILLLALCVYVIIGYMLYEFIRPCYGYLALSTFFSLSFFLHHSWDVLAVFSVQITCCLASTMASHAVIASDLHGIRFLRTLNRTTKATHTNHMELLWD